MAATPRTADRPCRITNDAMKPLAHTVARFCGTLARLPDGDGSKAQLVACRRSAFQVMPSDPYEQAVHVRRRLAHLAAGIDEARAGTITNTQRSLRQLQHAYRSLQGLMIGVPDRLLNFEPGSGRCTIRHVLQRALAGTAMPACFVQHISSTAPCACRSCPGTLSAIFEIGEHVYRAVVEGLRDAPDLSFEPGTTRGGSLSLIIHARVDRLSRHLLDHQVELRRLLKSAGHRRTLSMRLAHRIFMVLGDAEGAMIGAESRFEGTCQPLIDLIAARTDELARYR
ncbi:hypothetical protein J2739_005558 [Variovorax soli]|uniref:CHAD domain-containing protein n=2 Tax=Variovorax soli TaxID=376815 RepID=A0ABU1NP30_9BURK|nr:hypothetical protein [Variovorax soli]